MRRIRAPEGEPPKVSQFEPEPPYQRIITPGYRPYKEACEQAKKAAFRMMNEQKEKGTFDPRTFVETIWQKSPEYRETDRLWAAYRAEVGKKLQYDHRESVRIVRKNVRDVLKSVA